MRGVASLRRDGVISHDAAASDAEVLARHGRLDVDQPLGRCGCGGMRTFDEH
jgi:hypothetical protein